MTVTVVHPKLAVASSTSGLPIIWNVLYASPLPKLSGNLYAPIGAWRIVYKSSSLYGGGKTFHIAPPLGIPCTHTQLPAGTLGDFSVSAGIFLLGGSTIIGGLVVVIFVGVGIGVGVGTGIGVGVGTGIGIGSGVGVGTGVGTGVGLGTGAGAGAGVGVSMGMGVGFGIGFGVGVGTGMGVGLGAGLGKGDVSGVTLGSTTGTSNGVSIGCGIGIDDGCVSVSNLS